MNQIEQLTAERDEAREWVNRLQRDTQTLTCVYCGFQYPPGSPSHGASILTEHVRACEKHPMRQVEHERSKLRKALAGLVGVHTVEELNQMDAAIRIIPMPEQDRINTLNAIHALIETKP